MQKRIFTYVAWLPLSVTLFCLGTTGCSPNRFLRTYYPDTEPGSINSVRVPEIKGLDSANVDGQLVKVLLVHGIGHTVPPKSPGERDSDFEAEETSYSANLITAMRKELRLTTKNCSGEVSAPVKTTIPQDDSDNHPGNYGFLRQEEFRSENGACYSFYTLYWGTLSDPFKQYFLSYDWRDTESRAYYNDQLKGDLIDRSISDAVLFSGKFKNHLDYTVKQAVCLIETGRGCEFHGSYTNPNEKVFVISHSLGSRLVFDAVDSIEQSPGNFIDCLEGVFMLANQLPLLAISDQIDSLPEPSDDSPSTEMPTAPGLTSLRNLVARRSGKKPPLQLIAFSDPNDLLSYTIPPKWRQLLGVAGSPEEEKVSFLNVLVQNHAINIGVLVNPLQAHLGYWDNRFVWNIIAHGSKGIPTDL